MVAEVAEPEPLEVDDSRRCSKASPTAKPAFQLLNESHLRKAKAMGGATL